MLTPKVVAVELSYLPTKQLEANISSVTNVKAFLPVIVVVFSLNQYNRIENSFLKEVYMLHQNKWQLSCLQIWCKVTRKFYKVLAH